MEIAKNQSATATIVATATVIAAAANEDKNKNDNPGAVSKAVVTHKKTSFLSFNTYYAEEKFVFRN